MHFLKKVFFLLSFITIRSITHAQLMQLVADVQKIKDKELFFRDKPLKVLLKEIGSKIKGVTADGDGFSERLSYFRFRFVDREGQKEYYRQRKIPVTILVMIKGKFEWDKSKCPVAEREKWTRRDAQKFRNLSIAYLRIYGEEL